MEVEQMEKVTGFFSGQLPLFTALVIAAMAATMSCICLITGNWKSTGRPLQASETGSPEF